MEGTAGLMKLAASLCMWREPELPLETLREIILRFQFVNSRHFDSQHLLR